MCPLGLRLPTPCAGLFESHNGGASFSPAPHASLQCDGGGGGGGTRGQGEGHLPKFELVGAMMGLAIMQVGRSKKEKIRLERSLRGR